MALRVLTARASAVFICPPVALEYGYSARSGADHTTLMAQLSRFPDCPIAPTTADVVMVQNALWNSGLLRASGPTDVLIATYALANDATVIHYDGDFDHIQVAAPALTHRWILPRGSL